jgi:hypothetical protein
MQDIRQQRKVDGELPMGAWLASAPFLFSLGYEGNVENAPKRPLVGNRRIEGVGGVALLARCLALGLQYLLNSAAPTEIGCPAKPFKRSVARLIDTPGGYRGV